MSYKEEFFDDFLDHVDDTGDAEAVEAVAELRMIQKTLRKDGEFFIEFFLNDLDLPVPDLHLECWGLMTDLEKERVLLAIPRDHAKTTLTKLVVVWYFLFTKHRFCVYLSNTNAIALGACKDIMGFLRCENFVNTFGVIKMTKESETHSLWQFVLPMPDGSEKHCILRAIGQGQQMRGINIDNQRPDIAVIDDVEDLDNTGSKEMQKKLDRWMFGPFLKALARKKKILWLGNMLAKTSLLARLAQNKRWNPVVFGAIIQDASTGEMRPLWPGKWTIPQLREDYKEYRDIGLAELWMCEMMNMPGHGENGFRPDQLFYQATPTPDSVLAAWLTLDPAFGMTSAHDKSCIAVHVLPEVGVPMVARTISGHFTEKELFDHMMREARIWGAYIWGIESVAAQKVLITLFQNFEISARNNFPIEYIPLISGRGDPKMGRIEAFINLMTAKEYALPDSDLEVTTEILALDKSKKDQQDDCVDSCAYGPVMLERYRPLILAKRDMHVPGSTQKAKYGTEVCNV
jgi:hypothetical protein